MTNIASHPRPLADEGSRMALVIADSFIPAVKVPGWFRSFMRMGIALAQRKAEPNKRLVVAVSVPSRSLVAQAIAIGHSLATSKRLDPPMSASQVLATAKEIPEGSLVRVVHERRMQLLRFHRVLEAAGQLQMGPSRFEIKLIRSIEMIPDSYQWEPGKAHKVAATKGLAVLLGPADEVAYITEGRARVAVVGTRSVMAAELDLQIGMCDTSGNTNMTTARELLRPLHETAPVGWRSALIPAVARHWPAYVDSPELTILDGSQAISYWLDQVHSAACVSIVDRSASAAESGAIAIGQQRLLGSAKPLAGLPWAAPGGCEAAAYEVWA